mgnify:CR=1 FL=1
MKAVEQIASKKSAVQQIDIFDTPAYGRILVLDGELFITEKDEFIYHEMITHVPMAVHPNPRNILVIGAGDGGVLRELTRYSSVESIDLVEIDELVVEVCKKYLPTTACRFDDPRVHVYYEDGVKFIRRCTDQYDVIIVDSTDPFGPGEGLFTKEFYGSCFKALRDDGIMLRLNAPLLPQPKTDGEEDKDRDGREEGIEDELYHGRMYKVQCTMYNVQCTNRLS